jgi:hypothetical protein
MLGIDWWLIPITLFNPLVILRDAGKDWNTVAGWTVSNLVLGRCAKQYGRYLYSLAHCHSLLNDCNRILLLINSVNSESSGASSHTTMFLI